MHYGGISVADRGLTGEVHAARVLEGRQWSMLWDLPAERWEAVVEPALAALRALPDPGRARTRHGHDHILVFAPE